MSAPPIRLPSPGGDVLSSPLSVVMVSESVCSAIVAVVNGVQKPADTIVLTAFATDPENKLVWPNAVGGRLELTNILPTMFRAGQLFRVTIEAITPGK